MLDQDNLLLSIGRRVTLEKSCNNSIMPNPYLNQAPIHFWKTAVAGLAPRSVVPIRARRFPIDDGALIATAGSCFAQEVGKHLATMPGVTLLRAETPEPDQPLFSALYGNVYTVRQLVQLFDRAFGCLTPIDVAWRRDDGRYVDPFRPYVFRDGFLTIEHVENARRVHLDAVRHVFMDSSVFIFTLGLTESWRSAVDGAVFPVAPGVVSEEIRTADYEFHNFTYAEVLADLDDFISRLRSVNPAIRVILTVSPVPLIATYTAEHVLVATSHSKAILRAVCGEVDTKCDFVHYFPSYEIISGHFNKGAYYADNLRSVTREGVEHVMAIFRQTYFGASEDGPAEISIPTPKPVVSEPICDEEEIVRSIGFD
ncbi:MAG: GSCFA domain-containing protein [Ancalomicrobiaceae bacterium]|nr:GSCFA domain-containing protein [Ancalomicrobiaceae bacterium]